MLWLHQKEISDAIFDIGVHFELRRILQTFLNNDNRTSGKLKIGLYNLSMCQQSVLPNREFMQDYLNSQEFSKIWLLTESIHIIY